MSLAHYSQDERMIEDFDRVYYRTDGGSPIIDRRRGDEVYA